MTGECPECGGELRKKSQYAFSHICKTCGEEYYQDGFGDWKKYTKTKQGRIKDEDAEVKRRDEQKINKVRCKICGKYCKPLGIARHRASHRDPEKQKDIGDFQ